MLGVEQVRLGKSWQTAQKMVVNNMESLVHSSNRDIKHVTLLQERSSFHTGPYASLPLEDDRLYDEDRLSKFERG